MDAVATNSGLKQFIFARMSRLQALYFTTRSSRIFLTGKR